MKTDKSADRTHLEAILNAWRLGNGYTIATAIDEAMAFSAQRGVDESGFHPMEDPTIEDGFGGAWSKRCPSCNEMTMEIVRPGKVQCYNCG